MTDNKERIETVAPVRVLTAVGALKEITTQHEKAIAAIRDELRAIQTQHRRIDIGPLAGA